MKELHELSKYKIGSDFTGSCIYYLFNRQKLVYIGKTCNLRTRMVHHLRTKTFTKVLIECVPVHLLDSEELLAIRRYLPKLNKHVNGSSPIRIRVKGERKVSISTSITVAEFNLFGSKMEIRRRLNEFLKSEIFIETIISNINRKKQSK